VPRQLTSEEGIDIFIKHIDDFCKNLDSIEPKVKDAILEEMKIDIIVRQRFPDEVTKRVQGSITKKPVAKDFKGFWKNLSTSPPERIIAFAENSFLNEE
jgi:hypothetical protein